MFKFKILFYLSAPLCKLVLKTRETGLRCENQIWNCDYIVPVMTWASPDSPQYGLGLTKLNK